MQIGERSFKLGIIKSVSLVLEDNKLLFNIELIVQISKNNNIGFTQHQYCDYVNIENGENKEFNNLYRDFCLYIVKVLDGFSVKSINELIGENVIADVEFVAENDYKLYSYQRLNLGPVPALANNDVEKISDVEEVNSVDKNIDKI